MAQGAALDRLIGEALGTNRTARRYSAPDDAMPPMTMPMRKLMDNRRKAVGRHELDHDRAKRTSDTGVQRSRRRSAS
jgi:hypothetical protein